MTTCNWENKRKENIIAYDWETENPVAVIALVHGYGEHFGRYKHFCDFYQSKKINVLGLDLIGHGKSEGNRGHIEHFDELIDSVIELISKIKSKYSNVPVILYGHSLGGNIVHNTIIKREPAIDAVITTGPWIQLAFQPNAFMMTLGKVMNKLSPSFSQKSKLDTSALAANQQVGIDYLADPLVHGTISARMGMQNLAAGDFLHQYKGAVKQPHFILHGADDQITSPSASKAFSERLEGDVTYKQYEGLRHEIHNELSYLSIFEEQYNWIQEKLNLQ